MNAEYRKALKRERDRERSWRKSEQGAFESAFMSLDAHVEKFDDPGKIAAFSDGGAGAESTFARCEEEDRLRQIDDAISRLSEKEQDFAYAVLRGATWRTLGMSKATFYRWVEKTEALLKNSISQSADI